MFTLKEQAFFTTCFLNPLPLSDIDIDIELGFSQPKLNVNVIFQCNVGERERVGKGMPQFNHQTSPIPKE